VGDVFGSALAAEGLFAFFLESGFLAVLVFGWDRVSKGMHFLATLMVALGSHFSAVWIVIANSWQQTPAGFHVVQHNGFPRAEITDFWAMVFNPSSVERLCHVISGAWLAGAFLVLSVSAFYLIKKKHLEIAKAGMQIGLVVALIGSFGQLASGHLAALVVSQYQPAKLAAMEGHFVTREPADLHLFGWVDEKQAKTHGVGIPGGLAFLTYGDFKKQVTGLDAFDKKDRPPVPFVFQTYHLMVAIGMSLIGLSLLGAWLWWRKTLYDNKVVLWLFVGSVLLPQTANQVGWWTAEVGRQPWVVYGLMRTSQGISPIVSSAQIIASIVMFSLVYLLLFALFLFLLNRKIQKGPVFIPGDPTHEDPRLSKDGREGGHNVL
jgi:cytochrome d ubiquinol oxidase subunit I